MKIEPLRNYLLIKEYKPKVKGGLVKPENEFDKHAIAEILAIGPEIDYKQPDIGFRKGDIIVYDEFSGVEIEKMAGLIDEEVILVSADKVIAKVKKGK